METERYIVLRRSGDAKRKPGLQQVSRSGTESSAPQEYVIELQEISSRDEAQDLANDPNVVAAPEMPLKLHEPTARGVEPRTLRRRTGCAHGVRAARGGERPDVRRAPLCGA